MSKTIAVFGASGATGQHVIEQALDRGWAVRAIDKSWKSAPARVDAIEADVLKDDLAPSVRGVDAVISALGVPNDPKTLVDPPPLYTEGTLRIAQAMKSEKIRRLVVMSASFVESTDRGPLHFRMTIAKALTLVLRDMADMERILRATELDWTSVRPGWLMDGAPTDDYVVTDRVIPQHLIRTRHADVAQLMLDCIANDDWVHGYPAIAREEDEEASSPMETLRAVVG